MEFEPYLQGSKFLFKLANHCIVVKKKSKPTEFVREEHLNGSLRHHGIQSVSNMSREVLELILRGHNCH